MTGLKHRAIAARMALLSFAASAGLTHADAAQAQEVVTEQADSQELAQQRFLEATQAFNEGRYSAAASLFDAADRLAPHASTRFNAATAWEQAGELARAATGYQAALDLGSLDGTRSRVAENKLAALRGRLSQVRVRKPLGALVSVDHVQRAPVPARFYLRPGTYAFEVEYRGETAHKTASVHAGQQDDIQFPLLSSDEAAPAPPPPGPRPTPPVDRLSTAQETWGWVALGAGVALAGAAVVLGLNALSAEQKVQDDPFDRAARTDAQALQRATNIAWGGAAGAGGLGVVLLLTAPTFEF